MRGRWRQVWSVLWPILSGVSLRVKIMGIALVSIFSLGLGITWQARAMMVRSLQRELEQRGISIARDLAFRSTDLVLTNNLYGLYTQLLRAFHRAPFLPSEFAPGCRASGRSAAPGQPDAGRVPPVRAACG
jgi:hypothetical protein